MKIFDENYYTIHGWMLNRLNLKGTALMVYAIIYGFSQDGQSEFTGSRQYLCNFIGATKPTIDKALEELCNKELIIKISEVKNGIIFNRYKISYTALKNFTTDKETLLPGKEILQGGGKETLPNNNINNNSNNYIYLGEYKRVKLKEAEYIKLISEFGKEKIDYVIKRLDEYVQTNDNKQKYKDYNLVIRKVIREHWYDEVKNNEPDWLKDYKENINEGVDEL